MNKKFIDWLSKPRFEYKDGIWTRGVCRCGDFQCHGKIYCHNCGGKFEKFDTLSHLDLLRRKLNYNKFTRTIEYFVALNQSEINKLGLKFTIDDFTDLLISNKS